jgi:hypothetical protein
MSTQVTIPDLSDPTLKRVSTPVVNRLAPESLRALRHNGGINIRAYRFIVLYAAMGFTSASRAYRLAGYKARSESTAGTAASMLLNNPSIQKALRVILEEWTEPYKARVEAVLMDKYLRRATYDIADFVHDDGSIVPLSDIPKEWREAVIDGMEVRYYGGSTNLRKVLTYKLASRDDALKTLARYIEWISGDTVLPVQVDPEKRKTLENIFSRNGHDGLSVVRSSGDSN